MLVPEHKNVFHHALAGVSPSDLLFIPCLSGCAYECSFLANSNIVLKVFRLWSSQQCVMESFYLISVANTVLGRW